MPPRSLHVVPFPDSTSARIFADAVKYYLMTVDGEPFLSGPERAGIWLDGRNLGPVDHPRAVLYVTQGALQAAALLGLPAPTMGLIAADELPEELETLLDVQGYTAPDRVGQRASRRRA